MRARLLTFFVVVFLSACSPQPVPKQSLPKAVAQMSGDEARALYKECSKYGSPDDPRIIYSNEDCVSLHARMNSADWAAASKNKGVGVGQPILH